MFIYYLLNLLSYIIRAFDYPLDSRGGGPTRGGQCFETNPERQRLLLLLHRNADEEFFNARKYPPVIPFSSSVQLPKCPSISPQNGGRKSRLKQTESRIPC